MDAAAQEIDATLARQARAGDANAFAGLMERHQQPVFHFLLYRCGNRQDAEDVAQTTFLAAYRALDRFDDHRPFTTWIFTIARRQCIDLLRRRRDHQPLDEELFAVPPENAQGPDDRGAHLWELARAHLSANQADALWMVYKEDLSIEEAARALGWTRLRVKVTLHRARERLKNLLGRTGSATQPLPCLQPEKP